MIGFAWIQSRTQVAIGLGGLLIVAIVAAITGPHLLHLYDSTVATCRVHDDCQAAGSAFLKNDRDLQIGLDALAIIVPGLIGLFWGPPLVAREFEMGTFRLAWTQSVTRTRWLAVKLGMMGLASMAVAGLISLMVTWWSSPVDRVNMTPFTSFDQRDLVPIGYAAFAFALGVTFGVLMRRTLPAMATTLVAFVAARLCWNHWIRPHLIAPAVRAFALNAGSMGFGSTNGGPTTLIPNPPNLGAAWIVSDQIVNKAGTALTPAVLAKTCPTLGSALPGGPPGGGGAIGGVTTHVRVPRGAQNSLERCVEKLAPTYHLMVAYQPSSRYWAFQWYELAAYICAALILGGICIWTVRRRVS